MALVASDVPCRCGRGQWLDEVVPRHVARAEVFAKFERWAREQEIYDVSDLAAVKGTLIPVHAREMAAVGIRAADLITRAVWQRIAVGALDQRQECERRVKPPERPVEAAREQPRSVAVDVPAEAASRAADDDGLFPVPTQGATRPIVDLVVAGGRL